MNSLPSTNVHAALGRVNRQRSVQAFRDLNRNTGRRGFQRRPRALLSLDLYSAHELLTAFVNSSAPCWRSLRGYRSVHLYFLALSNTRSLTEYAFCVDHWSGSVTLSAR